MKRVVVLLAAVLLIVPVVAMFAVDWGGSITTTNTVQSVPDTSDADEFVNAERLVLFLTGDIGATRDFVSQLGVTFDSEEPTFAVDLERLYLRNRVFPEGGSVVRFESRLGRFGLVDPTGMILNHAVDGAGLSIQGRWWGVRMSAGTTALLNKEFSNVAMSIRDAVDAADDDVYFGPGRFIGQLRVDLPELFARQNLSLALVAQEDMRDPASVVQESDEPTAVDELGGLIDTQYIVLTLDGPILNTLFYEFGYALGLGRTLSLVDDDDAVSLESYSYQPIRAHMVSLDLAYFIPDFLSSVVRAGVRFTTGDDDYSSYLEGNTDGDATMFIPISPSGTGAVFDLQPGNTTTTAVSYGLKPFETAPSPFLSEFQTEALFYTFFRTAGRGPVSLPEVDPSANESYLGSELDIAFRFRPYSDLGFGLTTGMLFANEDALFDDADAFSWLVRLEASLSF
jgi:hypothetical protein